MAVAASQRRREGTVEKQGGCQSRAPSHCTVKCGPNVAAHCSPSPLLPTCGACGSVGGRSCCGRCVPALAHVLHRYRQSGCHSRGCRIQGLGAGPDDDLHTVPHILVHRSSQGGDISLAQQGRVHHASRSRPKRAGQVLCGRALLNRQHSRLRKGLRVAGCGCEGGGCASCPHILGCTRQLGGCFLCAARSQRSCVPGTGTADEGGDSLSGTQEARRHMARAPNSALHLHQPAAPAHGACLQSPVLPRSQECRTEVA